MLVDSLIYLHIIQDEYLFFTADISFQNHEIVLMKYVFYTDTFHSFIMWLFKHFEFWAILIS